MRRFFFILTFLVILLASKAAIPIANAQSPTPEASLSCEVSVYKTSGSSLPVESRTRLSTGEGLNVGSRYLYTFNLKSNDLSTDKIRYIAITPVALQSEPVNILHVLAPFGPCTQSPEKRIECSASYSFNQESIEPIQMLISPYYSSTQTYTSWNFYVQTDKGTASCFSTNQINTPTRPSPTPAVLPAVTNLRVTGFRTVTGTDYKEAVIEWNSVESSMSYEIMRASPDMGIYSIGRALTTKYVIRFKTSATWNIAIYTTDWNWNRGTLSDVLTIKYPGYDTLPEVPDYYASPTPSATTTPTITPPPFDSSKLALLEEKVSQLELSQQSQENRLGILESFIAKIKQILSRIFGRI